MRKPATTPDRPVHAATNASRRELTDTGLVRLLRAVTADSLKDVALFRIDKSDPQELVAVCIYATILELSQSELVLLADSQTTALAVVLRSLLEAYDDLRALLKDPGYCNNMYATFVSEKQRLLRNVEKSPWNPFSPGMEEGVDVAAELQRLKAELQGLVDDGRGPKSNEQRFASRKLDQKHLSIYWWLCLQSHSNMSALDDRHIEKDGDNYHVALFRGTAPADLALVVETLVTVLIDSAIHLHRALGTGAASRYLSYREIFEAVREEYSKAPG